MPQLAARAVDTDREPVARVAVDQGDEDGE
jgi:hypothetical protein